MKTKNVTKQPDRDIQVIIPYSRLEKLIQASAEITALRFEVKRIKDQNAALRLMFLEAMKIMRCKE